MLVSISPILLIGNEITAHQFIIAQLIYEKKTELLKKYLKVTKSENNLASDLNTLIEKNFLQVKFYYAKGEEIASCDFNKFEETVKLATLLSEGDYFDEFYKEYPIKVNRTDGTTDYLRSDLSKCRKLYANITCGNRLLHEHVLSCLKCEVEKRTQEGSWTYMKRMANWLTSEEWKSYEEQMESLLSDSKIEEPGYGQTIE